MTESRLWHSCLRDQIPNMWFVSEDVSCGWGRGVWRLSVWRDWQNGCSVVVKETEEMDILEAHLY